MPPPNHIPMIEPIAAADQVVAHLRGSVRSMIEACVATRNAVQALGHDRKRLDAFLQRLAQAGVLTPNEVKLGRSAPKISMMIKVGGKSDFFLQPNVIEHLEPEVTIAYELARLHDLASGAEGRQRADQRVAELIRHHPSRVDVQRAKKIVRVAHHEVTAIESQSIDHEASPRTMSEVIASGQRFDLVLATPSKRDVSRLRADYVCGLEEHVPLVSVVHDVSRAMVVVAPASDQISIATKLLGLSGFAAPRHVLTLGSQPHGIDITERDIVVAAHRGDARMELPPDLAARGNPPPRPKALANKLYPHAQRKLHIFADAEGDGWTSLPSDQSWIDLP